MKGVTKIIENETKGQKGGFLGMLLGLLGASLLGNVLTGKGMLWAGYGFLKKSTPSFNKLWNTEISEWA